MKRLLLIVVLPISLGGICLWLISQNHVIRSDHEPPREPIDTAAPKLKWEYEVFTLPDGESRQRAEAKANLAAGKITQAKFDSESDLAHIFSNSYYVSKYDLGKFGEQGFELVSVIVEPRRGGDMIFIFKRPKQ